MFFFSQGRDATTLPWQSNCWTFKSFHWALRVLMLKDDSRYQELCFILPYLLTDQDYSCTVSQFTSATPFPVWTLEFCFNGLCYIPPQQGYTTIFVTVDLCTKMVYCISCKGLPLAQDIFQNMFLGRRN